MMDWTTPLARLQFTTENTNLNFSTPTIDLSRYISKSGDAAHALAGFSDVWRGELTDTGQIVSTICRPPTCHRLEASRFRLQLKF